MPLKLALNMSILWVSREGGLLVQGILFLFFAKSCIVTTHVKHFFVRGVVINERDKASIGVRIVLIELLQFESMLDFVGQRMELPHDAQKFSLVEAWDVLQVEETEVGAHVHDVGNDCFFRILHVNSW